MGYFVRALIQSPPGKNLLGAGTLITWPDFLKLWCETQGKTYGGYDNVSVETVEKIMPGGLGKELGEMFAYASEFGYDGGDPSIIHPKDVSNFSTGLILIVDLTEILSSTFHARRLHLRSTSEQRTFRPSCKDLIESLQCAKRRLQLHRHRVWLGKKM